MKREILIAIAAVVVTLAADAQERPYGVVEFSANYMRSGPDYESPLDCQALMGGVVSVTDSSGYWLKITSSLPYSGWVNAMGIVRMTRDELKAYLSQPKYICTSLYSRVYSEPCDKSHALSDLMAGDVLRKAGAKGRGFLEVILPSGRKGWVRKGDLEDFAAWASDVRATPENLTATALRFLGVPYLWGGNSVKGMDCSGLIQYVCFLCGLSVPRDATPQAAIGTEVALTDSQGNYTIGNLKPADLLFFASPSGKINHVGLYLGDGRFIQASQVVRISSLVEGDNDYYERRPVKARRIAGGGNGVTRLKNNPAWFAVSD